MEEMDKIDRSIMFSEVNPKPISTHTCIHSVTKMKSLDTVQDEKWSNKPLPPLYTFLHHLMVSKEQRLQCSYSVPTEASYDRLTLIKCMAGEELEALQREMMLFNEFTFRGIKLEAANKSVWATLWWLKPSYFYKLLALNLQQVVQGTEPHLKDMHPPSNPYPENILLNRHLRDSVWLRPYCSHAYGTMPALFSFIL